jgi:hypothetical protein
VNNDVSVLSELVLRIKRGDSPAARAARDVVRWAQRWNVPESRLGNAVYGALYRAHDAYEEVREYTIGKVLFEPMVRARFDRVGTGLQVTSLPYIRGHARITVGDNCRLGYFSVRSGRFVDQPELLLGNSATTSASPASAGSPTRTATRPTSSAASGTTPSSARRTSGRSRSRTTSGSDTARTCSRGSPSGAGRWWRPAAS